MLEEAELEVAVVAQTGASCSGSSEARSRRSSDCLLLDAAFELLLLQVSWLEQKGGLGES